MLHISPTIFQRHFKGTRLSTSECTGDEEAALIREAAKDLLSLPWEIMHNGTGYLAQGADGARVRRRLPNREKASTSQASLPIRILLCSPRPEKGDSDTEVGYNRPPH